MVVSTRTQQNRMGISDLDCGIFALAFFGVLVCKHMTAEQERQRCIDIVDRQIEVQKKKGRLMAVQILRTIRYQIKSTGTTGGPLNEQPAKPSDN